MALHSRSGLRSKSSGLRVEADVERTRSQLPCLTRSGLMRHMPMEPSDAKRRLVDLLKLLDDASALTEQG